jgi:hypothetical protein
MTIPDPTAEIKAIRHRLGAAFDYDLERIFADIQRRQCESGRTYVTMPARRIANDNPLQRSGEASVVAVQNLSSPPAER